MTSKGNGETNRLPTRQDFKTMALYRFYHPQDPLYGSSPDFHGDIHKIKSDTIARVYAKEQMKDNGWRYVIVERKYKDTFRTVAKYNNPHYYVGCSPFLNGFYVFNAKETKGFGEDLEGAIEYARTMNEKTPVLLNGTSFTT